MVVVPATSTKMVPFVLLPLVVGKVDVEVKVVGYGVQDHVKKTLLVQVMDIPYAWLSVQTVGRPLGPRLWDHRRVRWAQDQQTGLPDGSEVREWI